MQITLPDPPLSKGVPIFGTPVSSTEFQGVITHGLFKSLVPDPRRLEGTLAKYNADLSSVAALRSRVQRLVNGAKRTNSKSYAKYIVEMIQTGEGFTPQIVLWCEQKLRVEVDEGTGFGWLLVPHEMKFVALDGDTQTAARNIIDGDDATRGLLDRETVKITIKYDTPQDQAQTIFAKCNSEGVKVSTSMAIGLDNRDDVTRLAKHVARYVPALENKVNLQKRQLGAQDTEVVTISALRASVVCFVEGIGGVQNQTRNAAIDDDRLHLLRDASVVWYKIVTRTLNGVLSREQRAGTFASSPAVWCAMGALGHDTLVELVGDNFQGPITSAALEHAFHAAAEQKLVGVDWRRGEQWLPVGAKKSSSGAVTIGGPKESGSLVYKALKEGILNKSFSTAAE